MFQLPPEVYSAIASHLSKSDLLTLSYTSKAFQRAAEPRIYESVHLRDPHVAIASFFPLLKNDAFRAPYVKRFLLYEDPRFSDPRRSLVTCPPQFWHSVQLVLKSLVNLDYLVIHDPQLARSWLLDDHEVRFQLREANLRLPWDASLVAFLEGQQRLQRLILSGGVVDDRVLLPSLSSNALPKLEVFSGSVLVTPEVLGCPLTRLQMTVDESTVLVLHTVVADIAKTVRTLRKLNILGMPEELCMSIVKTISAAVFAPVLRYLGVLTIPPPARDWSALYRCLMKLPALEMIEFDISRWEPHGLEPLQRSVVLDLHVYSLGLQQVVFWIGCNKFNWYRNDGNWECYHQLRSMNNETEWRI